MSYFSLKHPELLEALGRHDIHILTSFLYYYGFDIFDLKPIHLSAKWKLMSLAMPLSTYLHHISLV